MVAEVEEVEGEGIILKYKLYYQRAGYSGTRRATPGSMRRWRAHRIFIGRECRWR